MNATDILRNAGTTRLSDLTVTTIPASQVIQFSSSDTFQRLTTEPTTPRHLHLLK